MAPDYSINGIGSSYATDPYFWKAYNSPNFMAGYQSQLATAANAAATQQTSSTQATTSNVSALPQTSAKEESSGGGLIAAGLLAAGGIGATIYAAKKGNGKGVIQGFKNIFGIGKNAETEAAKAYSQIRASVDKNGKLTYTLPGKTKTLTSSTAINDYASKYGIDLKPLSKFNSKTSKLTGYKFTIADGGKVNTVTVKNGEIVDIHNGTKSIKEILESTNADDIKFVDKIKDKIAKVEKGASGNQSAYKDLTNIEYQTQIGDDIVTMTRTSISAKPQISALTTSERFAEDAEALKAYLYNNPDAKEVFLSQALKKGKLPDGIRVESFDYSFDKHIKCHFKDGQLTGITQDGKYYAKGTDKCDSFLADNESVVNKAVDKIKESGKLSKYENAVLVAA